MEKFRKKLELKYRVVSLFCCFATGIFCTLRRLTENVSEFASGILSGFFGGLLLVSCYILARYYVVLKNENKLKQMYIEETDERNIAITKETMKTASFISLLITILAVIVSAFFSPVVSITLAAAMICESVVTIIVHAYYKKHM